MNAFSKVLILIAFLLLPVLIGALSGFATATGVGSWYAGITKPSFNPPGWVFGPVWTTLYLLMGYSSWRVFGTFDSFGAFISSWPGGIYLAQLVLNFFWSILFFGLQQPGWAFVEIIVLWVFILLMILTFWTRNGLAGALQIPYLAWVSFASVLNGTIWWLNRS